MAYASKYYDPKKAHEYYMKNRKLKGRRSTRGFSQKQKEQWSYAKYKISEDERREKKDASMSNMKSRAEQKLVVTNNANTQRNLISESSKSEKKRITEAAKAEREKFAADCAQKVKAIRERIKNMPKKQRKIYEDQLRDLIDRIKEQTKLDKQQVTQRSQESRQAISDKAREDKKVITDKASQDKKKITKTESKNLKNKKDKISKKYENERDKTYKKIKGNK